MSTDAVKGLRIPTYSKKQFALPAAKAVVDEKKRRFSLNWKDCLMIAGLVLAVASAVAVFFITPIAIAIASIALAALIAFSAYYVHNYEKGVKIQNSTDKLRAQNEKLLQSEKQLTSTNQKLQSELKLLQQATNEIKKAQSKLIKNKADTDLANQNLQKTNKELLENLHFLKNENINLQHKVEHLQLAIGQFNIELKKFEDLNRMLSQSTDIVGNDLTALSAGNSEFEKIMKENDALFDQDILNLVQTVNSVRSASQELFSKLSNSNKTLSNEMNYLKTEIEKMKQLSGTLQESANKLQLIDSELQKKSSAFEELTKEMTEKALKLEQINKSIADEESSITKVKEAIAIENSKLNELTSKLDKIPETIAFKEKLLEEKLLSLTQAEENLKLVTEKTEKKIQELKELKIQLKQE